MNSDKVFKITYKEVPPNPPIEFAEKMAKEAKGSTEVVSIGGGSTIDVGKYVSHILGVPHKAIPTTAGTGSEVTKYAVFVKSGRKYSFEGEHLIPEKYELRPELIVSLPRIHTIASGLDALSQAIESWWSPKSTKESREYSVKASHLVTANLYESTKNPDNEFLRMNMLKAANYSGRAINITRTSICHALSYPITIKLGIPHGIACAMHLPIFMRYFGIPEKTTRKVEMIIDTLGIKRIQMTDDMIAEALSSDRAYNTPKPITKDVLEKLL